MWWQWKQGDYSKYRTWDNKCVILENFSKDKLYVYLENKYLKLNMYNH